MKYITSNNNIQVSISEVEFDHIYQTIIGKSFIPSINHLIKSNHTFFNRLKSYDLDTIHKDQIDTIHLKSINHNQAIIYLKLVTSEEIILPLIKNTSKCK